MLQALRVASVLGAGCTVTDLAAALGRPTHELLSIVADGEAMAAALAFGASGSPAC
ncbi:hypothetical protein [Streptomyces inhibens]|uniref:hypothetical protein n=1 Tax=Streptomyces inhibens TaxID=2293571 RepID=UPI0015F256AB|nr:hypothetical protein [Streptomyces inhibens]